MPGLPVGSVDLNSDPHTCVASSLLTEASPQPCLPDLDVHSSNLALTVQAVTEEVWVG